RSNGASRRFANGVSTVVISSKVLLLPPEQTSRLEQGLITPRATLPRRVSARIFFPFSVYLRRWAAPLRPTRIVKAAQLSLLSVTTFGGKISARHQMSLGRILRLTNGPTRLLG